MWLLPYTCATQGTFNRMAKAGYTIITQKLQLVTEHEDLKTLGLFAAIFFADKNCF